MKNRNEKIRFLNVSLIVEQRLTLQLFPKLSDAFLKENIGFFILSAINVKTKS